MLSVLLWEGPRTPRTNHNSSEISFLMELEARPPKFSVPPSHWRYQTSVGPKWKIQLCNPASFLRCLSHPHPLGGSSGEGLVGLQTPWGAAPHKSWAEMDKERPQLWHGPPPLVPTTTKTLPRDDPTSAVQSITAPNAVSTFLLKIIQALQQLFAWAVATASFSLAQFTLHTLHWFLSPKHRSDLIYSHAQEPSEAPHFKGYKIPLPQHGMFAPLLPPDVLHCNHTGLISSHRAPPATSTSRPLLELLPLPGGPFPPVLWSKSYPSACALPVHPPCLLRADLMHIHCGSFSPRRPTENSDLRAWGWRPQSTQRRGEHLVPVPGMCDKSVTPTTWW